MKCPICSGVIQERSIAPNSETRLTNYLCVRCLYRTVRAEKNNIISVEQKSPVPIAVSQRGARRPDGRHMRLSRISSAAITQEQSESEFDEPDQAA